jgi:hypothetical protein
LWVLGGSFGRAYPKNIFIADFADRALRRGDSCAATSIRMRPNFV